jgi:hypothetical protein
VAFGGVCFWFFFIFNSGGRHKNLIYNFIFFSPPPPFRFSRSGVGLNELLGGTFAR